MMRVLVADDDENSRVLLRAALEARGYTVDDAADGAQALKLAQQEQPDLIVSDIMMPEMDGFAFCAAVKNDTHLNKIPFGVVSSVIRFIRLPGKRWTSASRIRC
ncbi:MAG: response regulator [Pseudomonadota bacterium]